MLRPSRLSFALLSVSLLLAGPTLAAGTVTGISASKTTLTLGQSLDAAVQGMEDAAKGCFLRVSMKYADNSVEVPHPGFLAGSFPSTGFYLKPTKAGKVTLIADGSPNPNSQNWPACKGMAQTDITVTAPIVANPTVVARPNTSTLPTIEKATLTGIKQVPYTNHSGETWIEASGTGNCTFTIQTGGVAPQTFSTTAAKPFPIKVKIANAPLGGMAGNGILYRGSLFDNPYGNWNQIYVWYGSSDVWTGDAKDVVLNATYPAVPGDPRAGTPVRFRIHKGSKEHSRHDHMPGAVGGQ